MTSPNSIIDVLRSRLPVPALGGLVLLLATLAALLWANSAWGATYSEAWGTRFALPLGALTLEKPVLLWINDGLMALFFLLVGLEIKREIVSGELHSLRRAALPIAAALGGMVGPAVIYLAVTAGTPEMRAWGVPMATDIAFALGVLALLGSRVPIALKVFLTALAIVDDLGAILVIALFYTEQISGAALSAAAILTALLVIANRSGVRSMLVYGAIGALLWFAVLKSGVHATVAGVIVALAIPAQPRPGAAPTATPLHRLEHALLPWVMFLVMPIFALANAGIDLRAFTLADALSPVALGIAAALFLGNQAGILGCCWLVVRSGFARLPEGVTWRQVHAVSLLAGIGFTMSLFIAGLAFPSAETLAVAKLGILIGSALSGGLGFVLLWCSVRAPSRTEGTRRASPAETRRVTPAIRAAREHAGPVSESSTPPAHVVNRPC